MQVIDIIILILLVLAIFKGIKDGFVRQVGGIIGLFLGIYLAIKFSSLLSAWMHKWINVSENIVKIISFVIIIIGVCICMSLLGKLFEKILKIVMLGWLNKILGIIISIFTMALFIGIILSLIEYVNANWFIIISPDKLASSKGVQIITNFTKVLFPYLQGFFK